MLRRWVLPLLVGLALVPAADATTVVSAKVAPDAVDTTLYFHRISVQDMPINTQVPDEDYSAQSTFGASAETLTCLDPAVGGLPQGMTKQAFHTYYGYSSPSFVEYGQPGANGEPRVHPERGLSYDIPLEPGQPLVLHWFMAEESGLGEGPDASAVPNVIVHAALRESDAISVDGSAYDEGRLVAEGTSRPVTLASGQVAGDGAGQVTASNAAGRWVYGFAVPLPYVGAPSLNASLGFNVRIDVMIDAPGCQPGQSVMVGTLEPWSDAQHRPRLLVRNGEPLRVLSAGIDPASNGTASVVHWNVISGWGNYDVDVRNVTVQVLGPEGDVPVTHLQTVQRFHEHGHYGDPVEQLWSVPTGDLPDGHYVAFLTVDNLQGTATATASIGFDVQDGRLVAGHAQQAPAPRPVALVLAMAAAVALARRRR